jgi:hypothetical protein
VVVATLVDAPQAAAVEAAAATPGVAAAVDAVVPAGKFYKPVDFSRPQQMQSYPAVRMLIQEQSWLGARNNRLKNGKKNNSGKRSSR